ncbi:MAG: hypothetical protein EA365_12025 [Gloeocapsa sp. DLM2.Bin57]|nr:MAG: hypothetical protein EA365_12025 [Gloeocapsa sp. DLM2.Bin57]
MSKPINPLVGSLLVVSTVISSALSVSAANIPLANPSFESPDLSNTTEIVPGAGPFDFETPTGWNLYNPNNLIPPVYDNEANSPFATAFTGVWRPSSPFFATIPDGAQIVSIYINTPGQGVVGLSQNTGVTIAPNTTYRFSAAVGNPQIPDPTDPFFDGFPGYRLELLAGNTVIATDDNSISIDEKQFRRASIAYTSSENDTYQGEELGIRLINLNLDNNSGGDGNNGREVTFDDVRLEEIAVPDNGMSWQLSSIMMLTGLVIKLKTKK